MYGYVTSVTLNIAAPIELASAIFNHHFRFKASPTTEHPAAAGSGGVCAFAPTRSNCSGLLVGGTKVWRPFRVNNVLLLQLKRVFRHESSTRIVRHHQNSSIEFLFQARGYTPQTRQLAPARLCRARAAHP